MADQLPVERAPRGASLLHATEELDRAIARPSSTDRWHDEVHQALRSCVLALEARLDDMSGRGGMEDQVGRDAPQLLPALERLEADLARALIEAWEAKATRPEPTEAFLGQLRALRKDLQHVEAEEFDLVGEMIRPTGALD